ncbi:MAG: hypothetical protein AVO35_08930 [Candidatus Aegiribacteria sp. MLS_C]|nr:MAG: hypothetical protein AVO35_08930 [Candidatus Aegiribacteria sp. MLS_C]
MEKAFITGRPVNRGGDAGPAKWAVFLFSVFVFAFCLALLYMGMRGVMRLGGFVASGGPYQIAHQAPDWVWVFPVSIMLMVGSMFASMYAGSKVGGPNLMALAWSALFLVLGWNFVEFGFGIGTGGGLAWGWVICAVTFLLMGGVPLAIILSSFFRSMRERSNGPATGESPPWGLSLLLQAAAAAGGALLGLEFFSTLS